MLSLSIAKRLKALSADITKCYVRTYAEFGYEMGVGRAGEYAGHAHLHFGDLLFSPVGVSCASLGGRRHRGQLLIVPPRTSYRDIRIGDFFFLKWLLGPEHIRLPEKIDVGPDDGNILSVATEAKCDLPMWNWTVGHAQSVRIELKDRRLSMVVGRDRIRVRP